jgi:HEAT repeat protein
MVLYDARPESRLRGGRVDNTAAGLHLHLFTSHVGLALAALVLAGAVGCGGSAPETVASLIEKTSSPDPRTRARAAQSLGEMGEQALPAIPALIDLLQDSNTVDTLHDSVYLDARKALLQIGKPAIEPCIAELRKSSGNRRCDIIMLLGYFDDPQAVDVVLEFFDDTDKNIRDAVVCSLGHSKDPRIVPPLLKALQDEEPEVRVSALFCLENFSDPRAVEPLIAMLSDKDDSIRSYAAKDIGKQRDPRIFPALQGTLFNAKESQSVRYHAARSLGECGDQRALVALSDVLKDHGVTEEVRCGAAEGLGLIHQPEVIDPLRAVLADRSDLLEVREAVVRALTESRAPGASDLLSPIALSDDENEVMRFWAAVGVVKLNDGSIDDVRIVDEGLKRYGAGGVRYEFLDLRVKAAEEALQMVVSRGKSAAVRDAASELLKYLKKVFPWVK